LFSGPGKKTGDDIFSRGSGASVGAKPANKEQQKGE
jgi:hypothetical protein